MVVTTDGIEKNWCSLLVEMLDSGAPGWDSGGETLLLRRDGGFELWLDGAGGAEGAGLDAR